MDGIKYKNFYLQLLRLHICNKLCNNTTTCITNFCILCYLASSAMACVNQCKEWLKKYKPSKVTRVTEYTIYGIITGYSVSL